jgi:CRP-like cAMP-binding protein
MEISRLAALPCLRSLSLRELTVIAPYAVDVPIPVGRRVLLGGPFAHELALVAAGRGSVRCAGEPVAELGPGDAFGPLAPARSAYPTATVTALTALRLIAFSTRDVGHLRRAAPDTLQALLDACAQPAADRPPQRETVLAHAAAA